MPKKTLKPIWIALLVLIVIGSLGSYLYFGFIKQTIYGVPSEIKVGDIIKFHAIAQVGGRTGITCSAHPAIDPFITAFVKKELKDSCVGVPCNLYDQWSFSASKSGTYSLDVAYTCSGVTAPANDKLTFSVKESQPSKYCSDSEILTLGSYNIYESGNIHWYSYTNGIKNYDNKNSDECLNEITLKEWYCGTDYVGYFKEVNCPSESKCQNGACVKDSSKPCNLNMPAVEPNPYCEDNNVYANYQSIDQNTCTLKHEKRLLDTCGSDEKCSSGSSDLISRCVPNVEFGTIRNKECTKSGDHDMVHYQIFGGTGDKLYSWTEVYESCIGNQFCNPATLSCELEEKVNVGYFIENNECKFSSTNGFYSTEDECKKSLAGTGSIGANETKKDETPPEFDFKEFMIKYGILIGLGAIILIAGIVVLAVSLRREK